MDDGYGISDLGSSKDQDKNKSDKLEEYSIKIIELFIKLLVKISRFSHCEKYG